MQIPANESNVISLFAPRKGEDVQSQDQRAESTSSPSDLGQAMKKNFENRERMRRERLKANKDVLRSYQIKN